MLEWGNPLAPDSPPDHEDGLWRNWQPDGSYVLSTSILVSIQAYYRDLGVGPLILNSGEPSLELADDCLSLGDAWRPLGHVVVPSVSRDAGYQLPLCYYDAPNPEWVARSKCANLGLALWLNDTAHREIVCAPPGGPPRAN